MSLIDKLQQAGASAAFLLKESVIFNEKDMIPTEVPIINIALSGSTKGGLVPGLTVIAGPSKHFKSNLGLIMVRAYMKKYKDAVCLFYDSEFGSPPDYFLAQEIDIDRVLHIPIEHIEQLKFDISKRLDAIERGDKVVIFIDSIGNLASKKEVEDALNEKSVADMSRAKALKSLFRIVTPHLTTKDIPCIVVNHTYMEIGMYPKAVVSGGTGVMYSANTVWIIGRSQEKDGTEISGYNFNIVVDKSRYVRERSRLSFLVTYDYGVSKYSGLLDLALKSGHVTKPANGWYKSIFENTKVRLADTETKEFWTPILKDKEFQDFVQNQFQLGFHTMYNDEDFK
jgi:RecA/RadA recombinase